MSATLLKCKKGTPMKLDAGDNPTFDEWMARVDRIVELKVGVSVHDLTDQPFRDWYDARLRPSRAAVRALKHGGCF